jgi:hypothetical protein
MARIRNIKPDFWSNENLSALPEATHILAAALLNYADDEGFFNANPDLVKAACSPLRVPTVPVEASLLTLAQIGYVSLGDGQDGRRYGHVFKFKYHQKVNRPNPSKVWDIAIRWQFGPFTECSVLEGEGKWKGKWNREGDCDEHASRDSSPSVLTFPVSGGNPEWALTEAKIADYVKAFPGVKVLAECRVARQWCIDNPKKRKTPGGMPAFLTRWLSKAQNSGKAGASREEHPPMQLPTIEEAEAWRP